MRNILTLGLATLMLVSLTVGLARAEDKMPIKEAMAAHKKGELKKVLEGKGTEADKKKLLEVYEAMAKAKPPKGDEENWKKLNEAIVAAAKDVVAGKEGSVDALNKATNCAGCHKAHKP